MAAERLKNVAPGAGPGVGVGVELSPGGAKDPDLSPLPGLSVSRQGYPGLAPGATFLSRSAAGTASSAITKMSRLQTRPLARVCAVIESLSRLNVLSGHTCPASPGCKQVHTTRTALDRLSALCYPVR